MKSRTKVRPQYPSLANLAQTSSKPNLHHKLNYTLTYSTNVYTHRVSSRCADTPFSVTNLQSAKDELVAITKR